ncbi:DEAD/DEAH box helicase [Dyella nitratireducens]|uniref:ATP-dependent DNA helicase n=1 Tax=Dyella nitratireducens TaxID=1849580 RepID=A0ABQ1FXI1_9GAMM|nr:DEAD/DEAH box helicase [Dyella nitratireducens]GGA31638.1 ATP-dependent DNA helicase [Dyella nitratireducens]GLQ42842.1 ATP-dependent DNA helicase [Dyella nitratireducens]
MPLQNFHPAVAAWFGNTFPAPTSAQAAAWPEIRAGRHTLVAAPTGSGKTLTAFLAAIDHLVQESVARGGTLPDETRVVYVSPLKALSNDIHINLEAPLEGIGIELEKLGLPGAPIRTAVRTGDTPQAERSLMRKVPPHILVTTPESLYVLMGSLSGREMLKSVRSVIVDEIHAVAISKRGAHLAVTLERLEALCQRPLQRIGLSATQKPIEDVAKFLVGEGTGLAPSPLQGDGRISPESQAALQPVMADLFARTASHPKVENEPKPGAGERETNCTIIDVGHSRARDLAIEVPPIPLEAVMSNDTWELVYNQLAQLVEQHRTTLVFVNTRRMAERLARHLSERLGHEAVAAHHGSLAKEQRLDAEQRLKRGALKVLIATASLELGIDIGDVDLVCQLSSPRSIAAFLQRAGRSGHAVNGTPKARLFPTSRDDLVECAAMLDCVRRGELDTLVQPPQPLDVLAQQIVAEVACAEWDEDALFDLVRRAYPYRTLSRDTFNAVVRMLADGFSTRRGARAAYIHRDAVHRELRARRGARLTAVTSGGTIPDTADYLVVLEPQATIVGTVNEDFAVESMAGDIFQLGNTSYRIIRVERDRLRVEDAQGASPSIPFWLGEAPGRSNELSVGVSRLREEIAARIDADGVQAAFDWLREALGLNESAAQQIVEYLAKAKAALGVMPTQSTLVFERFFDESGGTQLVIHTPWGSRINKAWGLALRKRFCRQFNFELQAAATENAIVLSLSTSHSFPLIEVARYLHSNTAEHVLVQALLDAPLFPVRWRWNAVTSLALPRYAGGKKVPAPLQRMKSEDLLAAVFPDQVACLENIVGERQIPDHPLVNQTLHDCLREAMDVDGLLDVLKNMESGAITVVARDLTAPSPLASEVLNAAPYAFLDDAPLEERRTRAVQTRHWNGIEDTDDLAKLDPEAIAAVRGEAWPEVRSADEMHEALNVLGFVTDDEARTNEGWLDWLHKLANVHRATQFTPRRDEAATARSIWVCAEKLPLWQAVHEHAALAPPITAPAEYAAQPWARDDALLELVRGRLTGLGPSTVSALAASMQVESTDVDLALIRLQSEGYVMQGHFSPDASETEWCERHLLARIHRYTIGRLRREIEPVSRRDLMRFLLEWQHTTPGTKLNGPDALSVVLHQLEGFESAAGAWESELLASRIEDYSSRWLDELCRAGRIGWNRLRSGGGSGGPVRATPIVLLPRRQLPIWTSMADRNQEQEPLLSSRAQAVADALTAHGALFFDELLDAAHLLRTELEDALGELVSAGRVTSDSFAGLRALLTPAAKRESPRHRRVRRHALSDIEDAGRWSLLRKLPPSSPSRSEGSSDDPLEHVARVLLRRYGVIFWKLLEREAPWLPSWRELLRVYHQLEARGEIRGGRFVEGLVGEQFALPEAIAHLRSIRLRPPEQSRVTLSGSDPLNLVGTVLAGDRLPALAGTRVLYEDGVPVAAWVANKPQWLIEGDLVQQRRWFNALLRRPEPDGTSDVTYVHR